MREIKHTVSNWKIFCIPKEKNTYFYLILFLSQFLIFLYFGISLHLKTPSLFFKVCSALADSAILTFIATLLWGRWKFISIFFPYTVSLLIISNLLYYRNFFDLIPASLYDVSSVGDSLILESSLSSLRYTDSILIILSLLPTVYYLFYKKKFISTSNKGIRLIFLFLTVILETITLCGSFRRQSIYNNPKSFSEQIENVYPAFFLNWLFWYTNHNFTGYLVRVALDGNDKNKHLSSEELNRIRDYIRYDGPAYGRDSLDSGEYPSNLILVVVESLPYKIIEMNDSSITPTLYNLKNDPDVYIAKCEVLAKYGRSSDAQFIYNTGLLPLRTEPLVTRYAFNDYPSIAKALNKISIEIIGENGTLWSHNLTSKSYGFSNMISNVANNVENQDSILFGRTLSEISRFNDDFYVFMTTLSMHNPYDRNMVNNHKAISYPANIHDARDKQYIERLYHFDYSLGKFLKGLKAINKYDNSLIVIVGDHEISKTDISPELNDSFVPLIVINSPKKLSTEYTASQLDLFPTILDLMGTEYEYLGVKYKGLGTSLTQGSKIKTITDKDYEISETIIKSDMSAFD